MKRTRSKLYRNVGCTHRLLIFVLLGRRFDVQSQLSDCFWYVEGGVGWILPINCMSTATRLMTWWYGVLHYWTLDTSSPKQNLELGHQSLGLLIGALVLHFLAEAMGPVGSNLAQINLRSYDAGRSLGKGPAKSFFGIVPSTPCVALEEGEEYPNDHGASQKGGEDFCAPKEAYSDRSP